MANGPAKLAVSQVQMTSQNRETVRIFFSFKIIVMNLNLDHPKMKCIAPTYLYYIKNFIILFISQWLQRNLTDITFILQHANRMRKSGSFFTQIPSRACIYDSFFLSN